MEKKSRIQELAERVNMTYDEFIGEMRKRGCSEPTASKIWRGEYEDFEDFKDNDVNLSNLRKAAAVLKVEKTWIDGKRYFDAEEDLKLYQQNIELRNWLFKKMLEAQAAGEPAREGRSRPPRNYHCED